VEAGERVNFDLIVIGGGPGGCAAAISAARAGSKVLLLERGKFPRHKVCGEFVSAESLGLLRHLLSRAHQRFISGAPLIPRGRIFVDKAELAAEISPAAASITRFDLDSALWDSCIQAGGEARAECTVQALEGTGPFRVTTQNDSFDAQAVVNATGRWSNLTSPAVRTQNRTTNERWIGLKAHFREASAPASVDLYFFDGGYCGVQPVALSHNSSGIRINACAMVRADVATTLEEVLRCHPALLERSRGWEPLMDVVSASPMVFHDPEPVQEAMFQVGDSATFVDPFIGDGISLALRSGELAAECLVSFFREERSLEQATADYCRLYEERLARVFRASSKLRNMLRWPSLVRKPVLAVLQKAPSITKQLVKMTR
jgi:flavin-dependent dehydrogenase